jgi:hypothetical protein
MDWQKIQYDHSPKIDHAAEGDDFVFGFGAVIVVVLFVGSVLLLGFSLFG